MTGHWAASGSGLGVGAEVVLGQFFLRAPRPSRSGTDLAEVGEVDARGDEAAGVHQDAEAHHRQGPAGVLDQLEELRADLLAQPERPERAAGRPS